MNKKKVIYPGTFDPITYGHIDIIKRCFNVYDEVIVAIADNEGKGPLLTLEERIDLVKKSVINIKNVSVESFSGLLMDYAFKKGIKSVIRGLRAISDFEYEFQMALTNRKLCPEIETIFMMPSEEYSYISSRSIKEICALGGDVLKFVPKHVEAKLREKLTC